MNAMIIIGPLVGVLITAVAGWLFLPVTLKLAQAYDWLVTRGVPAEVGAERRERMRELRHQLIAEAREANYAPREIAPQIAWRMLSGLPDDITWWTDAIRFNLAQRSSSITPTTRLNLSSFTSERGHRIVTLIALMLSSSALIAEVVISEGRWGMPLVLSTIAVSTALSTAIYTTLPSYRARHGGQKAPNPGGKGDTTRAARRRRRRR